MNKELLTDKNIVVVYHADCADGFGAAWSAWKKFDDEADYLPLAYKDSAVSGLEGKEVYFLDFCYDNPEEMQRLLKATKKLIVIDHHKSHENTIRSIPGSIFDSNYSGAVLSWKYFHPDKDIPLMIKLIEDRDLWKFILPNTIEIDTAMDAYPRDFKTWSLIAEELETENRINDYIEKGKLILNYQQKILDLIIKNNTQKIYFEGHECYAVNAPHWFADLLGGELYTRLPPMAVIWSQSTNENRISLRSNGGVDVSLIAKKFGGGGHATSAGFLLPLGEPLPWKIINE